MKVHCPKCNSVNFLPSTLPSSIISNISCAVCKEMIDVPLAPEVDLPDEDLMDVSSLKDKLDAKGFLLYPDAPNNSETSETVSLESYQLPPLQIEDNSLDLFEDMQSTVNEPLSLYNDEVIPLPPQHLDDTLDLSFDDYKAQQSDIFQTQQVNESEYAEQTAPIVISDTEFVEHTEPLSASDSEYAEQTAYEGQEQEMQFGQEEQVYETENLAQPSQEEDDIWAQLRRETEELKQSQTVQQQMPPKELGPILLENAPRKSSGGFKFLIAGFLFLLLLGMGAGAFWIYINIGNDNEFSARQSPVAGNNPNPSTTTPNATTTTDNQSAGKDVNTVDSNTNSTENPKNHSNNNAAKTADSTNKNEVEQNNNAQANDTSNTQDPKNAKRERTVKNTNASDTPPSDANQGDGRFTIQVGSYPNSEGANERVSKLQSSGIPARVVVANIPKKGTWYRVQVGRFASRDEAERYARELKSKGVTKEVFVTDAQ